ncbi:MULTISPECIES: cache domain-containing sensor histidine kinase [Metabacillus]|uniref:Histidine kinase n=2 Tax=Metabacillus TaxID=2675233 RepID=A0A179T1F7_9BACI|nr:MULTISPECIES: sensor histidine kinase [Metabacillus]OAS87827.1 histidine kinase [Metabacillus litoralis]QNF27326.1 histidine kinase [Metabacillus sp. KUDC1714]
MKSIQSRLFLMLLIFIIIPYFLSVFFIYGYTKDRVEQQALEVSNNQMNKLSVELEQYFQDMIDLPYILYRNPDLFQVFRNDSEDSGYSNPNSREKSIETFYLMRNEIRQVRFYLDRNKESFTAYNAKVSAPKLKPDLLNQESIKKLYQSNVDYLIEPPHQLVNYNNAAIVPQSDNTVVMTFHHKVVDVLSNEFLGIITIDIDLNGYARLCNTLIQENEESVLLVDSNDRVMYASDTTLIGKVVPLSLLERINDKDIDSGEDILLSKTLSGPLNQWKLIKITPSQFLFHDARQTAFINIIVGIGVGMMGLLMIGFVSYRITRPIKILSKKVLSIEGGNMNVPFEHKGEDEIGHLEKHMKDMMDRINHHIEREYKLDIENRKNQFRALKSQVNPHFLFNALQSIGAVALRSQSPNVYQLVTSLSKMMRYSIRADQWVLVRDEVNYIQAYLSLQKERFGNNLNVSIKLNEDIQRMKIPSMVIQPLVENFFKHCYEEGFQDTNLSIYGEIKGETLTLTVENDGSSVTLSKLQSLRENIYTTPYTGTYSHEHIGLKNIHDRLVLNYGQNAGLKLDTKQGQGFLVQLVIPLDSNVSND